MFVLGPSHLNYFHNRNTTTNRTLFLRETQQQQSKVLVWLVPLMKKHHKIIFSHHKKRWQSPTSFRSNIHVFVIIAIIWPCFGYKASGIQVFDSVIEDTIPSAYNKLELEKILSRLLVASNKCQYPSFRIPPHACLHEEKIGNAHAL